MLSGEHRQWSRKALILVALVALAALAVYLRFAHLPNSPGWDGDEGYNWNIAANLAAGRIQMYGLRYSFVQHPPLFYLLAAGLMRLWTHDLIALRALSAASGVLTIGAVYLLGARLRGRGFGAAAALFLLLWPQAVLQERWAYTYNLLALLFPLALAAALALPPPARGKVGAGSRTARTAMLGAALAGGIAGLALTTDQEAVALIPALALLLWPRGFHDIVCGVAGAAVPPCIYIGSMLLARRSEFLFDIRHSAGRLDFQPATLLARFTHLLHFDPLIGLGLLGLLLLPRGPGRRALVIATTCLLLIVLAIRDPADYFRAAEPLLPLTAIGVAAVLDRSRWAMDRLLGHAHGPLPDTPRREASLRTALALVVLVAPFAGLMLARDIAGVQGGFRTSLDSLLPRSTAAAYRMADWLNRRVSSQTLVLIMPAPSWLLHCRTADLLQAVAISGHGTSFYPDGLPRDRFAYDTSLSAARYLVIDDFTRRWIEENDRERRLVATAEHTWPVVYRQGEYTIFSHPPALGT